METVVTFNFKVLRVRLKSQAHYTDVYVCVRVYLSSFGWIHFHFFQLDNSQLLLSSLPSALSRLFPLWIVCLCVCVCARTVNTQRVQGRVRVRNTPQQQYWTGCSE